MNVESADSRVESLTGMHGTSESRRTVPSGVTWHVLMHVKEHHEMGGTGRCKSALLVPRKQALLLIPTDDTWDTIEGICAQEVKQSRETIAAFGVFTLCQ